MKKILELKDKGIMLISCYIFLLVLAMLSDFNRIFQRVISISINPIYTQHFIQTIRNFPNVGFVKNICAREES